LLGLRSTRPLNWNKGDLLLRGGRGKEKKGGKQGREGEERGGTEKEEREWRERPCVSLNFP